MIKEDKRTFSPWYVDRKRGFAARSEIVFATTLPEALSRAVVMRKYHESTNRGIEIFVAPDDINVHAEF